VTFEEWAGSILFEHGFGRMIAKSAWIKRSAIADAREAELRAEIAAKDAEIERLQRRVEGLLKKHIDAMLGDDDKPQNDY